MHDGAEQPAFQVLGIRYPFERAMQLQEGILRQLLGVGASPRDSQRYAVHARLMLTKCLDESVRYFLSGPVEAFIRNGRSRLLVFCPHILDSTRKTGRGC